MSSSNRRRDMSPPRGGMGPSKLRMDRKPNHARISDPSLAAGKRKEIDNVMKKARAFPNQTWDKKLLEAEEKDPNRWRHTGYKKLYIEGDHSSSDSEDRERTRFSQPVRRSRSRSRNRRTPPSPTRRHSPRSPEIRRRSPIINVRKMPMPEPKRRPRSPQEVMIRRNSPKLIRGPPPEMRRRSPVEPKSPIRRRMSPVPKARPLIPRSKRPPSPPPQKQIARSPSLSSCSDDSCSACSDDRRVRSRSRSLSIPRARPVIPSKGALGHNRMPNHAKTRPPVIEGGIPSSSGRMRPMSPPATMRPEPRRKEIPRNHRVEKISERPLRPVVIPPERIRGPPIGEPAKELPPKVRPVKHKLHADEYPRPMKSRPPKPIEIPVVAVAPPKKHKEKTTEKLRARVKIEGEPKQRRPRSPSSGSDESSSSENSLPRFTATTRLTLSERFGKMAQWSVDRSNMENMRITKNSSGGDLKVMIEEGLESPPARYSYSPAPVGHFPEELMTTGPTGLSSWDDVRVRYEYYKGRGYLRDLDLQDYVKWEEWWYKYQEWLKQERYYEMWERSHMNHRRRKKIPISQRLN